MAIIRERSLKSFEPGALDYKRINATASEAGYVRNEASQRRYSVWRDPDFVAEAMFPFKLYRFQGPLDPSAASGTVWRMFRVRAGQVLESAATGTDGDDDPLPNADPDELYYPITAPEVLVPAATAKFWFWLEVGAGPPTTAVVRYGPDPTADSYTPGGGDPTAAWTSEAAWTGAPVPDASHIPIGWVDTNTHAADLRAVVRQLLRADVVSVGGGSDTVCPPA